MLELIRFDLRNPCEWDRFYDLFTAYLEEVCDEEEYRENIEDLHDDALNRQMIEQTMQEHNPYFVMQIVLDGKCVGLISYTYVEEQRYGFINNFFVCPEQRHAGIGTAAYSIVENSLIKLGANHVALVPVEKARPFYIRNGFMPSGMTADEGQVYRKQLI